MASIGLAGLRGSMYLDRANASRLAMEELQRDAAIKQQLQEIAYRPEELERMRTRQDMQFAREGRVADLEKAAYDDMVFKAGVAKKLRDNQDLFSSARFDPVSAAKLVDLLTPGDTKHKVTAEFDVNNDGIIDAYIIDKLDADGNPTGRTMQIAPDALVMRAYEFVADPVGGATGRESARTAQTLAQQAKQEELTMEELRARLATARNPSMMLDQAFNYYAKNENMWTHYQNDDTGEDYWVNAEGERVSPEEFANTMDKARRTVDVMTSYNTQNPIPITDPMAGESLLSAREAQLRALAESQAAASEGDRRSGLGIGRPRSPQAPTNNRSLLDRLNARIPKLEERVIEYFKRPERQMLDPLERSTVGSPWNFQESELFKQLQNRPSN